VIHPPLEETRQLKPFSSGMRPRRPVRMIRLRSCCFGATSYPIRLGRITNWYLPPNQSSLNHTGEQCINRPEIATPAQKIKLDNKTRFG
jgi:hypothetical protein